jgi:integrase
MATPQGRCEKAPFARRTARRIAGTFNIPQNSGTIPAFNQLRRIKMVDTTAEDFPTILNDGKVSVSHYLKRLHDLALGLGWLARPVLAPKLWPRLHFKPKRGITLAEQQRLLEAEKNPERNLYYQLLWETGAAQCDAARLTTDNIDWEMRVLT